jgi:translation initiation factor 1
MTAPRSRPVYSTDGSIRPPAKPKPVRPAKKEEAPPSGLKPGVVYVERSRKGRGGKTVTLVWNLPGPETARTSLLKELKAACGAGGALKDGVLELQGDHRERLLALLAERGFPVKPRGG